MTCSAMSTCDCLDIKQEGASWRDGAAFMHWERVQRAVAACAAVAGAAVRAVNREGNTSRTRMHTSGVQNLELQSWKQ